MPNMKYSYYENNDVLLRLIQIKISPKRESAREIATCKQNVGQKENLMHPNFQMDISIPWIDAAFT